MLLSLGGGLACSQLIRSRGLVIVNKTYSEVKTNKVFTRLLGFASQLADHEVVN